MYFIYDRKDIEKCADSDNPFAIVKYCEDRISEKSYDYHNDVKTYSLKGMELGYYKAAIIYCKYIYDFNTSNWGSNPLIDYCGHLKDTEKTVEEEKLLKNINNVLPILLQYYKKCPYLSDLNECISDIYGYYSFINFPVVESELSHTDNCVIYGLCGGQSNRNLYHTDICKVMIDYMKLKKDYISVKKVNDMSLDEVIKSVVKEYM